MRVVGLGDPFEVLAEELTEHFAGERVGPVLFARVARSILRRMLWWPGRPLVICTVTTDWVEIDWHDRGRFLLVPTEDLGGKLEAFWVDTFWVDASWVR